MKKDVHCSIIEYHIYEKKRKRNGGNGKETVSKRNGKETGENNGKETEKKRFKRNGKETLSSFLLTLSIYIYMCMQSQVEPTPPFSYALTGDL